ncbi:MAG TPA: class I SAM-dependent methyltransferase [Candidatus Polarisedimenticolia bacterium]|nr:class I SAM-dependent methyltransferase [Candidatus Polarisedimenticolia bacterium]
MDQKKLDALLHQAVSDLGAAFQPAMVVLGDRLGLYRGLAAGKAQTSAELARRTGTAERYVREWLAHQAAGGYVTYDPPSRRFHLTEEQAAALTDETSPAFLPGGFQVALSALKAAGRMEENFRTGGGMGWHEHDAGVFEGTERFFRPSYAAHLLGEWLPALDGVVDKLTRGARVADVGCGHGASTILMARAFPASRFTGFDYHEPSVRRARRLADEAGVADRCHFEVARSKEFPGAGYDLVAFFDSLHDMGDPAGAARHVASALSGDGTWMIVEPFAHDELENNLNPIGRVYYGASTFVCTPASLSQEVGAALGAQAGEARLREVIVEGGFRTVRRAAETPFNMVLEARR